MNAEPALRLNTSRSESQIEQRRKTALDQLAAARKAIGAAIFGQELVVEEALVTILSRRPRAVRRRARASPRRCWSRRSAACSASTPIACSSRRT